MVVNRDTNERSARRATVSKWKRWEFVLPRQRPKAFPRMYRLTVHAGKSCIMVVHITCRRERLLPKSPPLKVLREALHL